jgi:hypothetical protein
MRTFASARFSSYNSALNLKCSSILNASNSPKCSGITPTSRRHARAAAFGRCPSTLTRPAVSASSPDSTFRQVDFPAPFGPTSTAAFPGTNSSEKPSSATNVPYETPNIRQSTMKLTIQSYGSFSYLVPF